MGTVTETPVRRKVQMPEESAEIKAGRQPATINEKEHKKPGSTETKTQCFCASARRLNLFQPLRLEREVYRPVCSTVTGVFKHAAGKCPGR
jgi:hypothetical protein